MPNVIVKNRSQVFGYYDHNMLVMSERISDHLPKTKKYLQSKDFGILEQKKLLFLQDQLKDLWFLETMILLE